VIVLFGGIRAYPRLRRLIAERLETQRVDINLDRGLADCPWPEGMDPLDPEGEVSLKNLYAVVRTDQRVYFAGPVTRLTCYSAYVFGPDITMQLPFGEQPAIGAYPAPPLDPQINHSHDDLPRRLTAYRRARSLVDDFALPPKKAERARQSLDEWYAGNHGMLRGGASLGSVGTLATAGLTTELSPWADVVLNFSFRTDVDTGAVEVDSWKRNFHPRHRVKICFPLPTEGGSSWYEPPIHTEAEIAHSWFKPCPPDR
jgi:hypothetical protein